MSDWDYVVGETAYTQGFQLFDKGSRTTFDGTGFTVATVSILKSSLALATPDVTDVAMAVDTANPLRLTYAITTAKMPQTAGSYLAIITITKGSEIRKSFEVDLRVHRG